MSHKSHGAASGAVRHATVIPAAPQREASGVDQHIAISSGRTVTKKLSMLGIISGAALLTAVPFSLQWSQNNVTGMPRILLK